MFPILKHYVFIILFLFILSKNSYSEALCVGARCSDIPPEVVFGANLIDPALDAVYTKEFLLSMAEAAVLQNVSSSLMGASRINRVRIGAGYSVARTNLSPRNYFFENSELRELPNQGIAASPSVVVGANLGSFFTGPSPYLSKLNLHFHYFPYDLSEQNVPFLKLRKTDLNGKVTNLGLNLRYFPFYEGNTTAGENSSGFSVGLGLFQSAQTISLHSYDRRPTNVNLSGQRRKWIGVNDLTYNSNIYSATLDVRYGKTIGFFTAYAGLGAMFNQGTVDIRVERNVALSSAEDKDDFVTDPTLAFLDLKRNLFVSHKNWYGTIGMEFAFGDASLILEYLKNKNSESVSAGAVYRF